MSGIVTPMKYLTRNVKHWAGADSAPTRFVRSARQSAPNPSDPPPYSQTQRPKPSFVGWAAPLPTPPGARIPHRRRSPHRPLTACARQCAPYPLRSGAAGKPRHRAVFRRVHSSAPAPQANLTTIPSFVGWAAPLPTPPEFRIPRRRQITPPCIVRVRTAVRTLFFAPTPKTSPTAIPMRRYPLPSNDARLCARSHVQA